MKKAIKFICLAMAVICLIFVFVGCTDGKKNDTEKRWKNEGAWNEIYVYKGKGDLQEMTWDSVEKKGYASIWNTNDGYASEYVELYKNDPNYKKDTAFSFQETTGRHGIAFYTTDRRIWVRVMWTDSVTFLLVREYD